MLRKTRVQIDRKALHHNLRLTQEWTGAGGFFCPMVKANGYGHGDVEIATLVAEYGVSAMGVSLYEEALRLREHGLRTPLLVFAPFDRAAASAALTHQLTPVISRFEDLEAAASLNSAIGVHLKFNTGMNRLGFDEGDLGKLHNTLAQNPKIRVEGLCTHLTHGEEAHETDGFTQRQLARLKKMTAGFPGVKHAHKSASLAALHENNLTVEPGIGSRPGISIYGLPQDGHRTAKGLQPVLRWSTELTNIHKVEKGAAVGYGARWIAQRDSIIGVVSVGYGDGYTRALSNKGEMLFRGQRVPVVGSVCMDYTMVDLTSALVGMDPHAGEEIVLIGKQGAGEVSAGFLAEKAGTIAYEIVTGIQRRVAREVV